ncbi:hypothetical protein TNCT_683231 [Trichonephila clavata]|uniref:RNA-directed DNA polymerase n=1 Tax=Trichonephila clavata TaxID=2740835 RepID=A0A8X6FR84_TRICU|nr:hypothetical protein TNCT_683231 [Trichonephila clavata]
MTFGLRNAAQSFQRFLDSLFRDLPFCFVYIDDILIASRNLDEHISHLKEIFQRLDKNGLVLKISKCIFAKPEVDFLGHHVSESGIRPTTERIQAILDFNRPSTVKQLRRFLGMLNFYRRFLPNAAKHQTKLNDFLVGIKKNKNKLIDWDEDSIRAFEYCKEQLSESTTLAHPPPYEGPYPVIKRFAKYFDISIKGVSRTISIDRLKPCFFADPDPYKPTLVDKSSTTSTSPSIVSATPHHSQQSTSEQSSKLRVRFAEPPAQYVTRFGRAVHPSKRFLGTYKPKGKGVKSLKSQGSAKIGISCPEIIKVRRSTENVVVQYFPNHENQLEHLRLSESDRAAVAGRLKEGVCGKKILQDIREEITVDSGRKMLVEKKRISIILKGTSILMVILKGMKLMQSKSANNDGHESKKRKIESILALIDEYELTLEEESKIHRNIDSILNIFYNKKEHNSKKVKMMESSTINIKKKIEKQPGISLHEEKDALLVHSKIQLLKK